MNNIKEFIAALHVGMSLTEYFPISNKEKVRVISGKNGNTITLDGWDSFSLNAADITLSEDCLILSGPNPAIYSLRPIPVSIKRRFM